jgi:hypothetical protein
MTNDRLTLSLLGFGVFPPLIDLIVKVSILLVLACTIHAVLGRRLVLIRSGLWNAVLLAVLILPAACLGLPRFRVAWLPAWESSANSQRPVALTR